jgi:hypothetical protein
VLKHEEQAREVHEQAVDFRAATRFGKVIGWTFHVPQGVDGGFSWVDLDGDAPGDTFVNRRQAELVLRSYLRVKKQAPVNELGKRA